MRCDEFLFYIDFCYKRLIMLLVYKMIKSCINVYENFGGCDIHKIVYELNIPSFCFKYPTPIMSTGAISFVLSYCFIDND